MIMRITWGKVQSGRWDEYERAYQDTVVARSQGIPGLLGRWLVHDMDDRDAGYAVSLWNSMDDVRAYEQSDLFRELTAALQPYFVGDFRTSHCDVRVAEEFD